MTETYTSTLNAGLGMLEETRPLLALWKPGMTTAELQRIALASGQFPNMSARRLHNYVVEGFASILLRYREAPARWFAGLLPTLTKREFEQVMFVFTSRRHALLADFVREVYWPTYAAGRDKLANEDAQAFVGQAVQAGKTTTRWSASTTLRVAGYLTNYCADFGLLERGIHKVRRILPFRLETRVAAVLAYDLHCSGLGDNRVVAHPDWQLFGLERQDVLEEFKRAALQGFFIVQAAAGVTKISWRFNSMEQLRDALTQTELR